MTSLSPEEQNILRSLSEIEREVEALGNEGLQKQLKTLTKRVNDFFKTQRDSIDRLRKEVSDLKEKVKLYKSAFSQAQATWIWESHTTRFVLPPDEPHQALAQYNQMKEFLKAKKDEEALKRWENLQRVLDFEWTNGHYHFVKSTREKRNYVAHPHIFDLGGEEESWKDTVSEKEKKYIDDLLNMLKMAASLMKCGKLVKDYLVNKRKRPFRDISFKDKEKETLKMIASWDRNLECVQRGRLYCMKYDDAMVYVKKYVRGEYSVCANVVKKIKNENRDRLANLALKFDCLLRRRFCYKEGDIHELKTEHSHWEELMKITKEKVWDPKHDDALNEMKSLLSPQSRCENISDPEIAKCVIPDFLKEPLWSYALDIVDWFNVISYTTTRGRKRKASHGMVYHSKCDANGKRKRSIREETTQPSKRRQR